MSGFNCVTIQMMLALGGILSYSGLVTAFYRGRIVNGSQALDGEFPFMLSLRRFTSGRHFCGASIVNQNWALTAAHCVSGTFPARINVQYGSVELDANSSNVVNVSKIFVHEGYLPQNKYIHDIALIKLKSPLNIGARVRPIHLPEMQQVTPGNEDAVLIGWGYNAVSLRHTTTLRHFCAGTIIDDYWILTAAHCFTFIKNPTELKVQFGSNELYPKQPQIIDVLQIVQHEGYNPTVAIHDIALLKLKTSILRDKIAQPVELYEGQNFPSFHFKSLLIGWGLNATDGVLQNKLQKVELEVLNAENCRQILPAFVHTTNLCSFAVDKGQCSGDSGGALLIQNKQIGIVSWSLKPCAKYPGVFTNLLFYKAWIDEKLLSK